MSALQAPGKEDVLYMTVPNLPVGMLILSAYGLEDDVVSVGIDYQRSSDWHKRRPPI